MAATRLRLYELARDTDNNPVTPNRPTKSISAEDTFEQDIPLSKTDDLIKRLAEKVWSASRREARVPKTDLGNVARHLPGF